MDTSRLPVSRIVTVVVLAALLVALARSPAVAGALTTFLRAAEPIIADHPLLGPLAFLVLSALSAMLAFFSSALLVPVAVLAWGEPVTFAMLWCGWILGGLTAYALGRNAGRPLVQRLVSSEKLRFYEARLDRDAPWWMFLLLQLAVPSEIPGYLAGTLRYRLPRYLAALSLGELPYALGTVYLGRSVVQREVGVALVVLALGAVFSALAWRHLHRRLDGTRPSS